MQMSNRCLDVHVLSELAFLEHTSANQIQGLKLIVVLMSLLELFIM